MRPGFAGWWLGAVLGGAVFSGVPAQAQFIDNPVYLDDSTTARATLERLDELRARGSSAEAVRALQQLLDEEGSRLLPREAGADVFVTVRQVVHEALLARTDLLERYRLEQEPVAAAALARGDHERVERALYLTPSGFEATLRVAQLHLESARFHAARRSLEGLEQHPDFAADRARDAAGLARLLSRYDAGDDVAEWAARWAAAAGVTWQAPEAVVSPEADDARVVNAATGRFTWSNEPQRVDEVLSEPLESVPLTRGHNSDDNSRSALPPAAWTMPAVSGDTVFLNDGETVSAWDRFTFRPLWRVRTADDPGAPVSEGPLRGRRTSLGRNLEDPTTVTVQGDLLLAVTGRANAGERRGDPRLHAFRAQTGERLWSFNPESADALLAGGSIRGPVLISDGVAVVAIRKMLRRRRLVSVLLVGLDLGSGEVRWVTPLASTGSLPFQNFSPLPIGLTQRDGMVYLTDVLGVSAAVEAGTGRACWVARMKSNPFQDMRSRLAWTASNPIATGPDLIMISPDQTAVLRMDAATGAVTGSRPITDFGEPGYLVQTGAWLAAVGAQSVALTSIAGFEEGAIRTSPEVREPGIRGRVVPAGSLLMVPVSDGLLLLDPASPNATPRQIVPLTKSGNAVVLEGQAIVVDESEAHNFLSWEVASRLLEQRLSDQPNDPEPALIYAELAFRAGQLGRLIEITNVAVRAVEGLSPVASEEPRARLFEALAVMAAPAPEALTWASAASTEEAGSPLQDAAVVGQLLDRMGRLARTPTQRVIHQLAQADLHERGGASEEALERYQAVLSDPVLAAAEWRGGRLIVRAGLEAQRRLEDLVTREGLGVYRAFEEAAAAEVAGARPADLAAQLDIAQRYPVAQVSAEIRLRLGQAAEAQGDSSAAIGHFRDGLAVLARRENAGGAIRGALGNELAGHLVAALLMREQFGAAGRVVQRARAGGLVPSVNGVPVSLAGLELESGAGVRAAELGPQLVGVAGLLPGAVLQPLSVTPSAPRDRLLLVAPVTGELVLASAGAGHAEPRVRWRVPIGRARPLVVRSDASRVIVLRPRLNVGLGGVLEAFDAESGASLWTADSFDDAVRGQPPARGARVLVPNARQASAAELLVLVEDSTLVLLERSGRAVAYDLSSGAVLWAETIGVDTVVDAALSEGVLIAGGALNDQGPLGVRPALVSVDGRTGTVLQRIDGLETEIRWIRRAGPGATAIGFEGSVMLLDVATGQPRWNLADPLVRESRAAWAAAGMLTVMTDTGSAWVIDLETGRLHPEPINSENRMLVSEARRVAARNGRVVASTPRGVVVYTAEAAIVGLDPFDARDEFLPGAIADDRVAMVRIEGENTSDPEIELMLFSTETGVLQATRRITVPPELRALPQSVHTIDGAVLLGFGSVTMVVTTGD